MWEIFKKYHYLNTELHKSCEQYIGVYNGQIICHTGIIQFPMRKGWKRVHRFVVLPDYQGIGIGMKFINAIAEIYSERGYVFNLTTTTPALTNALKKSDKWNLKRYGRETSGQKGYARYKNNKLKHLEKASSSGRITYSFYFKKR